METPPEFVRIRSSVIRNTLVYYVPAIASLLTTGWAILQGDIVWVPLAVAVLFLTFKRWISSETVGFDEDGLYVPDYWFMKRFIPWGEVIDLKVDEEKRVVFLVLDTTWWRIVDTGMEDIVIAIGDDLYEMADFKGISHHLTRLWTRNKRTPDTLNQRMIRQVNTAWNYRNRRVISETFNMVSSTYILWIVVDMIFYLVSGNGMGWLPHGIFLSLLIAYSLLMNLAEKPRAIIAVRPNELGAVLFDGEDIVSNIRFVVMTEPYDTELLSCEIIPGEGQISQVSNFIQIHPRVVPHGELTHAVALVGGNHTRARGARIRMRFVPDTEDFEIPIYWN